MHGEGAGMTFRDVRYGLRNLRIWFRVVWTDRNWDHAYIFIILRHKLKLTEKLQRECGMGVHSEDHADNIKKCVLALDRLIEDGYDCGHDWRREDYMRQQDLDLLLDTMKKHIFGWWD